MNPIVVGSQLCIKKESKFFIDVKCVHRHGPAAMPCLLCFCGVIKKQKQNIDAK
jgi:hypothetical protein